MKFVRPEGANDPVSEPSSEEEEDSTDAESDRRPNSFFSVRRLLGSRQVVTQCLCQWTHCAASCIASSLGVSKESTDPYAVQILSKCDGDHTERKTEKTTKPTKPNPKPKPAKKNTKSQWTKSSMRIQQLMCWWLRLACIEATTRTAKTQSKAPERGAEKSSPRCGNPGSPQPGSRRSQRDAYRAQLAPQSQENKHALYEGVIEPAAGTLPWYTMQHYMQNKER